MPSSFRFAALSISLFYASSAFAAGDGIGWTGWSLILGAVVVLAGIGLLYFGFIGPAKEFIVVGTVLMVPYMVIQEGTYRRANKVTPKQPSVAQLDLLS